MQPTLPVSADLCAQELLEVIPEVMQAIRVELRSQRGPELSVLQLRVLAFLNAHPGTPLSAVAEHVGLTLASMSTHITTLVARQLVDRAASTTDRRYITLRLTQEGQRVMTTAQQGARVALAATLRTLSADELDTVQRALQLLRLTFSASDSTNRTEDGHHE